MYLPILPSSVSHGWKGVVSLAVARTSWSFGKAFVQCKQPLFKITHTILTTSVLIVDTFRIGSQVIWQSEITERIVVFAFVAIRAKQHVSALLLSGPSFYTNFSAFGEFHTKFHRNTPQIWQNLHNKIPRAFGEIYTKNIPQFGEMHTKFTHKRTVVGVIYKRILHAATMSAIKQDTHTGRIKTAIDACRRKLDFLMGERFQRKYVMAKWRVTQDADMYYEKDLKYIIAAVSQKRETVWFGEIYTKIPAIWQQNLLTKFKKKQNTQYSPLLRAYMFKSPHRVLPFAPLPREWCAQKADTPAWRFSQRVRCLAGLPWS